PAGTTSFLRFNSVQPGYFKMMGMRLAAGTTFSDTLRAGGQLIVNEGFARKYWPGRSAIGRRVKIIGFDGKGGWRTIVGVLADASTGGLTDQRGDPILYMPEPDYYSPAVMIRTRSGTTSLPGLRSLVASLDPHLPPPTLTSIEDAMRKTAERPRYTMA